jgi:hypothetical protein
MIGVLHLLNNGSPHGRHKSTARTSQKGRVGLSTNNKTHVPTTNQGGINPQALPGSNNQKNQNDKNFKPDPRGSFYQLRYSRPNRECNNGASRKYVMQEITITIPNVSEMTVTTGEVLIIAMIVLLIVIRKL